MQITVADRPLEEVEHKSKTYIAVDYNSEVSYKIPVEDESPFGEIERQDWPFTPFKILVKSNSTEAEYMFLCVRLDGTDAVQTFMTRDQRSITLTGIQGRLGNNSDLKEFCFSPPRPRKKISPNPLDSADKISPKRLSELGSIIVDIYKVHLLRTENTFVRSSPVNFSDASKEVRFVESLCCC